MAKTQSHEKSDPPERQDDPLTNDAATREAIARQSAERYRQEIVNINRTSDSEMERALSRG
jgi:hypothetical protein